MKNQTVARMRSWWQQKTGIWGILVLWSPLLWLTAFFGESFFIKPLLFLLSGGWTKLIASNYFSRPFPTRHAGIALEQPTIGIFIFWFVFFSIAALTVATLIRWISDMSTWRNYYAYSIPLWGIAVTAFAQFLIPVSMLAHYIVGMGVTSRRIQAVIVLIVLAIVWGAMLSYLLKKPAKPDPAVLAGNLSEKGIVVVNGLVKSFIVLRVLNIILLAGLFVALGIVLCLSPVQGNIRQGLASWQAKMCSELKVDTDYVLPVLNSSSSTVWDTSVEARHLCCQFSDDKTFAFRMNKLMEENHQLQKMFCFVSQTYITAINDSMNIFLLLLLCGIAILISFIDSLNKTIKILKRIIGKS